MQRLIADASKMTEVQKELGITVDESDMSFANIANAISVVQKNMGIAGATSAEAATTIQGSLASVKGAWENLMVAMTNGDDLSGYIDNIVTTLGAAFNNLMPAIEQSLQGIGDLIVRIAPIISEKLPGLVDTLLPPLLSAATSLFQGIVNALPSLLQTLIAELPGIVDTICQTLLTNLPKLVDVALQIIVTLTNGIAQSLPTLIPQIVDIVIQITETLIDNLDMLVDAAIQLITALIEGLVKAQPKLIEKMPELIGKLVVAIITNLPKILEAGVKIIMTLVDSLVSGFGQMFDMGEKIVNEIKNGFAGKVGDAKTWGKDLIQNFINGIKEKWEHLKQTVGQVAESIKDYLGFSEPEKGPLSNFHTYAPDMMVLFAKGISENSYKPVNALKEVGNDMMNKTVDMKHIVTSSGFDNEIDASSLAAEISAAVKQSLIGLGIYMDSKQVGQVIAPNVNNSLGILAARRI